MLTHHVHIAVGSARQCVSVPVGAHIQICKRMPTALTLFPTCLRAAR